MEKRDLTKIIDDELRRVGFVKKKLNWYLEEEELIKVVNLQKSNYGDLYYVNLSISFKELNGEKFPKEEQCHIRTRLDPTLVHINKDYDYLFNLDNITIGLKDYEKEIKDCIHENIVPQLEKIKSRVGILNIAKEIPAILNMIPTKVKSYLKL